VLRPEASLADGIAVRRSSDLTSQLVSRYVDEIVTVDEEEIAGAILMLLEQEKSLAEGAGAAALAAIVQSKVRLTNQRTVVPICGGNIDIKLLSRIIDRGLTKGGRLLHLRVRLPDRPGSLMGLTRVLARERANIVETIYNRPDLGVSLGETVIDLTAETRDSAHVASIQDALREAKFRFKQIQ
jgi:threonine dehydratase